MTMLITELRAAAALRPDTTEGHLMARAADELEQQEAHTVSLLRALDIISHDVLDRCDKTLAAVTRHLGPPPGNYTPRTRTIDPHIPPPNPKKK